MMIKFLGGLDIFVAIIIVLFQLKMIPDTLLFSLGMYLILKAIVFFGDALSIVDGIGGLYVLFMILMPIGWLTFIFAGYLAIKGFTSML